MNNRKITKMVENYSLDDVIGQGQYGKVYKATNVKTNKVVAIKVVKIQKFKENPKLEECTVNEIKTLSQMDDNRHVVQFIELLRSSNNYYFVYEFCSGGTLEDLLKKKKILKEKEALQVFSQLLEAFKQLRRFNIMHRDLKPTNILIHNNAIKLADFGFCKSLTNPKDMAQTMLGSPLYMAPEILRGQDYCVKADIWSLGVVLYELLFGICPYEEKSIVRLINLLNDGTLVIRKDIQNISAQTEALLFAMLVKDPEQRISWEQLFQIQINSDGEYIEPSSNSNKNSSSKKEKSSTPNSQQKPPPHVAPQQFQNAATSQDEVSKPPSQNPVQQQTQYHNFQHQNSNSKQSNGLQPQFPHHQRSVSSHQIPSHSRAETPSKRNIGSNGLIRDQSNEKMENWQLNQNIEKRYSEHREKNSSAQMIQQNVDSLNSNEILRIGSGTPNPIIPHPPQRENSYHISRANGINEEKSPNSHQNKQMIDSPLIPQRLHLTSQDSGQQNGVQQAVIRESYNTSQSNIKFQRQDNKRALTSVGGVGNNQKQLQTNNNIINTQQVGGNEQRDNQADTPNMAAAPQGSSSVNAFSNSDSKRNNIHYQTLEEKYKQPLQQVSKSPALLVSPPNITVQQNQVQKDTQASPDQVSTGQSSSGRSSNGNNMNITPINNNATSSTNSTHQINQNNNINAHMHSSNNTYFRVNSNGQLNQIENSQNMMNSSAGNYIPSIQLSNSTSGAAKGKNNIDISQRIVSEIRKERNKLFFLTQVFYELIDICENENYNLILPQITYQYYQQILLTRCEKIKKLIELNQTQISQQIDLPAPITTMDLARTMMNEGYIKLRSATEKEITLIEQNFLHIKNEYLYFEIYYQQNNSNEQLQTMKNQTIEQIIKSFIKQVIANNETDEGGEVSYIERLRICAKLVDIHDFDQILMNEQGNNINNWIYNKEIKNADKQKILSKIFNHQSLSPIN